MIACVSPRWLTAFLDTPRATAPAARAFWQQVTQSTLSVRRGAAGEFATLLPGNGDPHLRRQEVGGDRAGCHLDVHVDDVPLGVAHAVSCGAGVVRDVGTYVVMVSPGGFEFYLVSHRGGQARPLPVRCPGGHQSLVNQLCVDVPGGLFDDEVRFWTALTGWPRRSGERPEFQFLERPAGIPLRLEFQRAGHPRAVAAGRRPPRSGF